MQLHNPSVTACSVHVARSNLGEQLLNHRVFGEIVFLVVEFHLGHWTEASHHEPSRVQRLDWVARRDASLYQGNEFLDEGTQFLRLLFGRGDTTMFDQSPRKVAFEG